MFDVRMSSDELLEEYMNDLPIITLQALDFDKSEYVMNYLWKKHKQSKVVMNRVFTVPSRNKYLAVFIYSQTGRGKSKAWQMQLYFYGLMDSKKGLMAIVFYPKEKIAMRFTPHFFERYRERLIPICDWKVRNQLSRTHDLKDLMAIFFSRNLSITWIETDSIFGNRMHIFSPITDGVALIQWDKKHNVLQANTFVTKNMLDNKQRALVGYAETYASITPAERMMYQFPDFAENDREK